MKFYKKDEWQHYLKEQIPQKYGGYAVVSYEGQTELLYFAKHNLDGDIWFLEAPNDLRRIKIEEGEDTLAYEERGYVLQDGYAYDIDSPQCAPFLPDEIEIVTIVGSSEEEALTYLLAHDYKDAKWKN